MKTFIGGEIKEDQRGSLALIIGEDSVHKRCDQFLCAIGDDDYIHLTGVYAAKVPLVRAYVGVSKEAGDLVMRNVGDRDVGSVPWRTIDGLIVHSYFVDKQPAKPVTLVLESTQEGYVIAEQKLK